MRPAARTLFALCLSAALPGGAALAQTPDVVTSIKPVHSLVSAVMQGVGEPHLIVDGAASPHSFSLKPSSAQALEQAGIVFWIGPGMENFLTDAIGTLAADAMVVPLAEAEGLERLGLREGGSFDAHDHDHDHESDHEHEHDGHDHEDEHDHEHDAHEEHAHEDEHHDHEHEEAHAHDHEEADMHLWLDPRNAITMVGVIEEALVHTDPDNAEHYEQNARQTVAALDELIAETTAELAPVADRPFVVFHDAYHYFEARFGIEAAGSITVSPENLPGAQRLTEIRDKIQSLDAVCVFSEPQFEPRLVNTVTEGTDARSGTLDPLGADLENGPELYFQLIRNLAQNLKDCLQS